MVVYCAWLVALAVVFMTVRPLQVSVITLAGVMGLARSAPRDLTAVIDVAILLLGTGLLAGVLLAVPYAVTPDLPGIQATARVFFVARDVVRLAAVGGTTL